MKIMSDHWNCSDDSISSNHTSYSDEIQSDVEAELYSLIHHQDSTADTTQSYCFDSKDVTENGVSVIPEHCINKQNSNSSLNKNQAQVLLHNELYISDNIDNNELYTNFSSPCSDFLNVKNTNKKTDLFNLNITPINMRSTKLKASNVHKYKSLKTVDKSEKSSKNFKSSGLENCLSQPMEIVSKNVRCKDISVKIDCNKRKVIALESSDTDSDVILMDEDENLRYSIITTNLSNDTNSLSSDFSNDSCCSLSKNEYGKNANYNHRQNVSMPNIKLGENSKGLWHVDDEDLYRSNRYTGRYHEKALLSCSACKEKGHTAKACKVSRIMKCYICGGEHLAAKCTNKVCPRCYKGHRNRYCSKTDVSICSHCNMEGHQEKDCPDTWRRYHLTTDASQIIKGRRMKQDTPIYCFNCGYEGHFGAECVKPRMYNSSFPTWSSVISYNNPDELFKTGNRRGSMRSSPQESIEQSENQYRISQQTVRKKKVKKKKKKKVPLENNMPSIKESYFPRTPKNKEVNSQSHGSLHFCSSLEDIKQQWKQKKQKRAWQRYRRSFWAYK